MTDDVQGHKSNLKEKQQQGFELANIQWPESVKIGNNLSLLAKLCKPHVCSLTLALSNIKR